MDLECEICRGPAHHWDAIRGFVHYKCESCGHLFVFPRPDQQTLDEYYQGYDQYEFRSDRLQMESEQRIGLLTSLVDDAGLERKLLDVGCANGQFLSVADHVGWNVMGVDRSPRLIEEARDKYGLRAVDGIIEQMTIEEGPFSVVTAWEVIEHTVDPVGFFEAIAKQVQAGGFLAISTPLGSGLFARLMGSRFPMLNPPEHISIFSRKSLALLAKQYGLEEVSFSSASNLHAEQIASGLSKLLMRKRLQELSGIRVDLLIGVARCVVWLPLLIDKLGVGIGMSAVYRKTS